MQQKKKLIFLLICTKMIIKLESNKLPIVEKFLEQKHFCLVLPRFFVVLVILQLSKLRFCIHCSRLYRKLIEKLNITQVCDTTTKKCWN